MSQGPSRDPSGTSRDTQGPSNDPNLPGTFQGPPPGTLQDFPGPSRNLPGTPQGNANLRSSLLGCFAGIIVESKSDVCSPSEQNIKQNILVVRGAASRLLNHPGLSDATRGGRYSSFATFGPSLVHGCHPTCPEAFALVPCVRLFQFCDLRAISGLRPSLYMP